MPSINETIEFIKIAHAGQTDLSGKDYYLHPIAVMKLLPCDIDDDVKHAALLHDIIEDTDYTRSDLEAMGYSNRTLDAVDLVTKSDDDPRDYTDIIRDIINSGNKDAIAVKYADMSHNGDPVRMSELSAEKRDYFLKRYEEPLKLLRTALGVSV